MTWAELPAKLKIYISLLSCSATVIATWAVWDLLKFHHDPGWVLFAGLIVFTIPFYLFLPSVSTMVGIGDAYIMAIAMISGTAPCVVVTFAQTFLISAFARRPKKHIYKVIFNTSSTVCSAWLYSSIYHAINKGSSQFQDIIIPAAALAVAYFFANSMLTSVAIAWSLGEGIIRFWNKTCLPLAVDYSVSAASAVFIVSLHDLNKYFGLSGIFKSLDLFTALLIGVVWGWHKLNKTRVTEAEEHLEEQEQLYLRTVESLALAVDAKDQTTYGHIRRVRVYATGLAKLCDIKDANELKAIETGSLLHDIGKLAIDDYILNKPGRLSKQEFEKIKIHAAAGDEILQHVHFPFPVAKYVRYHHERWDGLGYPDGLKGEEIPLGARILAVADAFDAIRYSRPYKLSIPMEEALELLKAQSGSIYDPNLIKLFTEHIGELEQAAKKESESMPEPSFRKYFETANRAILAEDVALPDSSNSPDVPAELILLAEFCSTIEGHVDLQDVFPIFAGRMRKMIPFSTCAFYLRDNSDCIRAVYAVGKHSDQIQNNLLGMGKGISGWVAAYKRPMINTGPALDFQDIKGDFSSFKDALVIPITREDECLGTISLYSLESSLYTQFELNILQTLASFLAPVIAQASNHENTPAESVMDPTTRVHRISYLTALGPQMIAAADKNRTPVSMIYIEIRNLGSITRTCGSHLGNLVLKKIADCVRPELRETDILVRFGHQAFIALLPGVRDEQALHCAQRLKHQIKSQASTTGGQTLSIDCPVGIASYPKDGTSIFALLQSAQKNVGTISDETSAPDSNVIGFFPRV
jgi:diguanylate cyclase (GGDEF)-like protein